MSTDIDLFTLNLSGFEALYERFIKVFLELQGPAGTEPIWQPKGDSSEADLDNGEALLAQRIQVAQRYLPIEYQEAFAAPLLKNLGHLIRSSDSPEEVSRTTEALVGAVVQHAPDSVVRGPLRQYLAVVSNLYRSFLAADKRSAERIPLAAPQRAPLVSFRHLMMPGPFVLATPATRVLCGSNVAVVSMPATYSEAPLTWAPLAH
jgi:hypothetical protein